MAESDAKRIYAAQQFALSFPQGKGYKGTVLARSWKELKFPSSIEIVILVVLQSIDFPSQSTETQWEIFVKQNWQHLAFLVLSKVQHLPVNVPQPLRYRRRAANHLLGEVKTLALDPVAP